MILLANGIQPQPAPQLWIFDTQNQDIYPLTGAEFWAIIKKLRTRELPEQFSSRDVWRPGWALLSDRDQVVAALELLVELDWLATTRNKTGGREATVYYANPKGLQS